ncbi:MAG: CDP-alcohol phosphatidyltransferase family protein [Gemmatimonadetes bacterium]|nr:CDP-alcohol phosphatidyltransferase family protein [Gemmatimonadota bacterium]MDA1103964.1 CDP-alcohol phosphatidyltransferase family protein [Gemmatimonadota bacterium]
MTMAATRYMPDSRAADLTAGFAVALLSGGITWWVTGQATSYLLLTAGLYATLATFIWIRIPKGAPGPGLGPANRITLGRAALAVPVLALALRPEPLGTGALWWVIGLSTVVLVLDIFDGKVARRTGTQTRFGARFDMEVDAAVILTLSAIVWQSDKVGAWVLLIGGMRYLFVAASWIWSALRAELPPSTRRQTVCVVQGVALLVALGLPDRMAVAVVGASLAALVYSFGVDVRWAVAAAAGQPGAASASEPAAASNTSIL